MSEKKKTQTAEQVKIDESSHFVCYAGNVIQNRYQVEAVLGEGAYGRVVRVKDIKTLESKALKIFKTGSAYQQGACREIKMLQLIATKDTDDTSLCIKILDWFQYNGRTCIVCNAFGMSVHDYMKDSTFEPFTLVDIRHIGYQLCHAVQFLHSNGITHSDIKPDNLLFVDSTTLCMDTNNGCVKRLKFKEIRLIDLGAATSDDDLHMPMITTRNYRAPEVLLKLSRTHAYDVWSIGCTLFELYFANILFPTEDDDLQHLGMMEELLGPIPRTMAQESDQTYFIDGKLNWKWNDDDDEDFLDIYNQIREWFCTSEDEDKELSDLIRLMLTYEPTERITVAKALDHPFFDRLLAHQLMENVTISSNH